MRVPLSLSNGFGAPFEELLKHFAIDQGLLGPGDDLSSPRFLARSVVPHIRKLSSLFNREEKEQSASLDPYWKESSNPAHLRMAYFLYFMPCNLFRMASVWSELHRLGYRWNAGKALQGIEFGAGPASGVCGIASAEHHAQVGIPEQGNWALIEQDKASLELGSAWAEKFFSSPEFASRSSQWGIRKFHRKIDPFQEFLPRTAPKFNLWISSFFLNELSLSSEALAKKLLATWEKHLDSEGLIILVEPALKLQSRRLLELRQAILKHQTPGPNALQVLLPCLGHQACGALAAPDDWCHEDVSWWRPPYFKKLDQLAELDRKSLPFSYLVMIKSQRPLEEILPRLKGPSSQRYRLVSPAHKEGQDQEFFLCGQDGKRRARYRPKSTDEEDRLQRGDILNEAEVRGDVNASRVNLGNSGTK